VVALVVYLTSNSSPDPSAAAARDTMLLSARQDIVVLNTLDYRDVDAGLKRWAAASTGTLHNSLTNVTASEKQHIVSAKSVTTAKVLDAAVVSLDTKAGSATVIASIDITVTPDGGKAVVKRERLRAELTRVGSVWRVNSIAQVGVTIS
jgi:Mce-associated membrane protein